MGGVLSNGLDLGPGVERVRSVENKTRKYIYVYVCVCVCVCVFFFFKEENAALSFLGVKEQAFLHYSRAICLLLLLTLCPLFPEKKTSESRFLAE